MNYLGKGMLRSCTQYHHFAVSPLPFICPPVFLTLNLDDKVCGAKNVFLLSVFLIIEIKKQ